MNQNKKGTKIALGTWSWGVGASGGDQIFGNHLGTEDLEAVFDAAMKVGLQLWDTAAVYGMGASEEILGTFVKKYPREQLVLSTKFTPQIAEDCDNPVEAMCDASMKRLGTDYIDIYWIHNPADVEKWTPYLIPLVKSGKIKQIGVSNHNLAQIQKAEEILNKEGVSLSAVQNHYSLLYRSSEDAGILDYCKEKGMDFYAYMVLEQGALSGKYNTKNPLPADSQRGKTYNPMLPQLEKLVDAMAAIGQKYGVGVPQIAIAWAIGRGTKPIIGVTKPHHVEDAAKALDIVLTAQEMEQLDTLAKATDVNTKGFWERPMVKK